MGMKMFILFWDFREEITTDDYKEEARAACWTGEGGGGWGAGGGGGGLEARLAPDLYVRHKDFICCALTPRPHRVITKGAEYFLCCIDRYRWAPKEPRSSFWIKTA